jgi:hypothetical protein
MNSTEKHMVEILTEMKEKYHVTGVKAEFEAEGTRLDEAMRLKEMAMQSGISFNLKIGGCEAIRDLFDAITLGTERIIAPMVESHYALQKFLKAAKTHLVDQDMELLINLETISACNNFDKMLEIAEISELKGIVIGRVDLAGSLGLDRRAIDNDATIKNISLQMAAKANQHGLKVSAGGAITANSLPFLQAFPTGHLDRFETRKVIFSCPMALDNPITAFNQAINKAIEFEMLWLKNKKNYYGKIYTEDDARIAMIQERLNLR